ncbi:MAG TPA: hypothetical protein VGD37_43385, partial [Kofleriaceae bacterium]
MQGNDAEVVARRDGEVGRDAPSVRTALEAELGDVAALAKLFRTAERYARVRRGSEVARELVWDAIGDLVLGDLTYDPERTVISQLEQAVRRRANRWRRANRPRRDAPEPRTMALDKAPASAIVLEAPQQNLDGDHQAADPAELVSLIREQARGDEPVRQLLALYDRGVFSRRDVLATGMTEWVYRAAKDRLVAYAATAAAAPTA